MKITAQDLKGFGIIDEIVEEPVGGAHRDKDATIHRAGEAIRRAFASLAGLDGEDLRRERRQKFLAMGRELKV